MAAIAPLRIDGPPPVAPDYGFTTTPGVLVTEADGHWMAGVAVDSYPDDLPSLHAPCADGSAAEKETSERAVGPTFGSYTVYIPMVCDGKGLGNEAGFERLRKRARETFRARESYGVERQFSQGAVDGSQPFLADGQGTVVHTAVGPREAAAQAELAIGGTAQEGVIHITPGLAAFWFSYDLLVAEGAALRTKRGNLVIIGNGYTGAAPPGAATLVGTDHEYLFATGPVRATRDEEVVLGPTRQVLDRSTNDVEMFVERNYVAYWDKALQFAQRVDRSA